MKCEVCGKELSVMESIFALQDKNYICFKCVRKRQLEVTGVG
jgi:hypothetical protein